MMSRFYVLMICFIYAGLAAFCTLLLWFSVGRDLWLSAFIDALIAVYSVRQIISIIVRDPTR